MSSDTGLAPAMGLDRSKQLLTETEIRHFVEKNLVEVSSTNLLARCVDGRPSSIPLEDSMYPLVSYPGANGGDVLNSFAALCELKISLDNDAVFGAVLEAIGGKENFRFHSDHHAEAGELACGMGCGHMKNALNNPEAYGVTKEQAEFLFEQLGLFKNQQDVLQGEHGERAVIIAQSDNFGVRPYLEGPDGQIQAFVYQETLHKAHLKKLASMLCGVINNPDISEEQVYMALEKTFGVQLSATLQKLAAGLPVYRVTISKDKQISIEKV